MDKDMRIVFMIVINSTNKHTHNKQKKNVPKVVIVMMLVDRRRAVEYVVQNRRIGTLNFGEAPAVR